MNGCFENKMMFAMSMPTCVSAKFAASLPNSCRATSMCSLKIASSCFNIVEKQLLKPWQTIENPILTTIFPSFSPKKRGFQPFFCRSACIRRSSGCSSSRRRWKSPKPGRWRPLHVASARAAPRGQASGNKKRLPSGELT